MSWIFIISVLVGLGRFLIHGHPVSWPGTYEALAHIWIGILATVAVMDRDRFNKVSCWTLLIIITTVEAIKFLVTPGLAH